MQDRSAAVRRSDGHNRQRLRQTSRCNQPRRHPAAADLPEGRMIMNKKALKLMWVGALVACAGGGGAIGLAWATPGVGITTTILAGPTALGAVTVKSESDSNEV